LYAVIAMGAVFTAAARAPLTSLASVLEMTGDFALTLPVMLAVAVASAVSAALSYGTIYTTKLLRRGIDLDEATGRAFKATVAQDPLSAAGDDTQEPASPQPHEVSERPDRVSDAGPAT
jgi:CIC family chloride channel protein